MFLSHYIQKLDNLQIQRNEKNKNMFKVADTSLFSYKVSERKCKLYLEDEGFI